MQKSDFFLFGATSEVAETLIQRERLWFEAEVERFILVQRQERPQAVFHGFDHEVVVADAGDFAEFRRTFDDIAARLVRPDRPIHVLPTYGAFNPWHGLQPLRFRFSDSGYQVNLNSRLQIIDALRVVAPRARFHLLGSLLGSFPYLGDYALSMWAVNELPRHPEHADLDLRVYNLGGMKTGFWDHAAGPKKNPFVHDEVPTRWLVDRMASAEKGVFTCYPSAMARVAIFLAQRGLRLQ